MSGVVKNGPYGRYYEWVENNEVKRLSLGNNKYYHGIEEDAASNIDRMFKGETLIIDCKSVEDCCVYRCEVSYSLNRRKNYKISERVISTVYDSDIIGSFLENLTISTLNIDQRDLEKSITAEVHKLNTAVKWRASITFKFNVSSDTSLYELDIRPEPINNNYGFNNDKSFRNFKVVHSNIYLLSKNLVVIKVVPKSEYDYYEEISKEYGKQKALNDEARKKAELEAKKKAEEDRINSIPWEEVTMESLLESNRLVEDTKQYNYLVEFLSENYPNRNPKTIVLYKQKRYNGYEHNIHSTVNGYSISYVYFSEVLPKLNIELVATSTFFLTDSKIVECSESFDHSITHKAEYKTYND